MAEARALGEDVTQVAQALTELTTRAAGAGLLVPERVGDWHPWVVKAGRLSFETGRVVVRLGDPAI